MLTRLFIIRHAEAEGNVKRIFHGWTDSTITEKGHEQAKMVARKLEDEIFDLVTSSPLSRTRQTAEYIIGNRNVELSFNRELMEINGGEWEGVRWDELSCRWPRESEDWDLRPHMLKMPSGESMEEFQNRLICAVHGIISENEGRNICIVTHGTAIKALMCYFKGLPLEEMINVKWCENTAVNIVDYDGVNFNIIAEGDFSHLEAEMATVLHQGWQEELERKIQDSKTQNSITQKSTTQSSYTQSSKIREEEKL